MSTRTYVLGLAVLTALAAWGAAAPASAGTADPVVRWDIITISSNGVILAGGKSVSTASATGDTLALKGTGDAEPAAEQAHGGGRFVHRRPDGSVVAKGVYTITRFISWQPAAGSFRGVPVRDAIGAKSQVSSGVLKMGLTAFVRGKAVARGTITITCALPGAPARLHEGTMVTVRIIGTKTRIRFNTTHPDEGPNLFHVIH